MTIDTERRVPNSSVHLKFERLVAAGSIDNIEPLRLTPEDITETRVVLRGNGLRVDDLTEHEKRSFLETQFRNLDSCRGPGVVAVMGREKAQMMLEWCLDQALKKGGKRIIHHKTGEPIEGTQGRSRQQTAADIIQIAVFGGEEAQEAIRRINRRIWRFIETQKLAPETREKLERKFAEFIEPRPERTLTSISPSAVQEVWLYLTGRL